MKNGMRRRMALLLACAMTFTGIDSNVLLASAAEVTDDAGHVHSEAELQQIEEYAADEVVDEEDMASNAPVGDAAEETPVQSLDGQLVVESIEEFETEPRLEMKVETEAESDAGAAVQAAKTVSGIAAVEVPHEVFLKGLDYCIVNGTKLTLQYTDGTTGTYTLNAGDNNDSMTDSYGNEINYFLKQSEEEHTYHSYEELTEGEYLLAIQVGEQTFYSAPLYRMVSVENSSMEALNPGDITFSGAGDGTWKNWYTFTAPEDGKYKIAQVPGGMDIRVKAETGFTTVTNSWNAFEAEAGKTYYLGFQGSWNSETQQYDSSYTYSTTLRKVIGLTGICDVVPGKETYLSGLDSGNIAEGTQLTAVYSDGTSNQVTLGYGSYFQDEKGNDFTICVRKKGEEGKSYSVWESLSEGAYALELSWAGETFVSDYIYTVKSPEHAGLESLTPGAQIILTGAGGTGNSYHWYTFTAPETGKYKIGAIQSNMRIWVQTENGLQSVNCINHAFKARAGETYYLGFQGKNKWDGSAFAGRDEYTWTTSFSRIIQIKEIQNITPAKQIFLAGLDSYITKGTSFTLVYENGVSETATMDQVWMYEDSYGNEMYCSLVKENESDSSYQVSDVLEEGNYALQLRLDGEIAATSDYVYQVRALDQAGLPTWSLGPVTATCGEDGTVNWYQMEAPENGIYTLKKNNGFTVYELVEGKREAVEVHSGRFTGARFTGKKGHTYYLGMSGGMWDDDVWEWVNTWNTELIRIPAATKIEAIPENTEFYEETDVRYISASVTVTYEDGSEYTGNPDEGLDEDKYGTKFRTTIREKGAEACLEDWDSLEVGVYIVHIGLDADGDGREEVSTEYEITVKESPSPFNGLAEATPLTPGQQYEVALDEENPVRWFSYKPEKDTKAMLESLGYVDTYVELFDARESKIGENDDGGEETNFRLKREFSAGETYYFKVREYAGNAGNGNQFQVSFTECLEITALEVVRHELKAVYLAGQEKVSPDVFVKATYSNGSENRFSIKSKDKYENRVRGRVVSADTKEELSDYSIPGTYLYQITYGDIVVDVAEFRVERMEDYITQPVTVGNGAQAVTAQDRRLMYRFAVEELGIYKLESNLPFEKLVLYNSKGETVPVRWFRQKYITYVLLEAGSYYATADLKTGATELKISAAKALLPTEVKVKADDRTLIAGLDYLTEEDLSTEIKYANGDTLTVNGNGEDVYGNCYSYEAGDSNSWWSVGETLPVGTYKIRSAVMRTGTGIYTTGASTGAAAKENRLLRSSLTPENRHTATIEVVMPDLDKMEKLQQDIWTEASGYNVRHLYTFTAQKAGTYYLEQENSALNSGFYAVGEEQLENCWNRISLKAGETCVVAVTTYAKEKFCVREETGSVEEQKNVQSIQLKTSRDYFLQNEWPGDYTEILITYEDQTQETYSWNWDWKDRYGNVFENSCKDNARQFTYTIWLTEKPEVKAELVIPRSRIEEAAVPLTEGLPITVSKKEDEREFYQFVAEEDGEYTFSAARTEGSIYVTSYEKNRWGNYRYKNRFRVCAAKDGVVFQYNVYLKAGEVYYLCINPQSYDEENKYTLSVSRPKQVKEIEVIKPEEYNIYAGMYIWDYSWLKLKATYADGTSETLAYKDQWQESQSENGLYISVGDVQWLNHETIRIYVRYGSAQTYIDLPAKSWDDIPKVEENKTTELSSEDGTMCFTFTPLCTGTYRLNLQDEVNGENGIYDCVVLENESGRKMANRSNEYSLVAGTQYNVLAVTYGNTMISVAPECVKETEEHTHIYEEVQKDATCTEAGYRVSKCKVCGEAEEGSYEEIPALGHQWQITVIKEATDTEEGIQAEICGRCKEEQEDSRTTIPMTGHQMGEWHVTKEATCENAGAMQRSCEYEKCGLCKDGERFTETESIPALGHELGTWTITEKATCTVAGEMVRRCSRCEKNEMTKIPATGHIYVTDTKEATCEEDGYTREICSVCEKEGSNEKLQALGHKYGEKTYVKEATCTQKGIYTQVCERCGETISGEEEMLLHDFLSDSVAATCTESGYTRKICKVCQTVADFTVISATGHTYGDWNTTEEATCTVDGSQMRSCTVCGENETKVIPATGHEWEQKTLVAATETTDGISALICKNCQAEKEGSRTAIPMTGHQFGDWSVTKEATCTEDGLRERSCTNENCQICDGSPTTQKEVIPATGHDVTGVEWTVEKEATCTEEGRQIKKCTRCDEAAETEVIQKKPHIYQEQREEATCTNKGYTQLVCENCHAVKEGSYQELPALGHTFGVGEIVAAPTCTEQGLIVFSCENKGCPAKRIGVLPTLAHTWQPVVAKEATCSTEGVQELRCVNCQKVKENSEKAIPRKPHTWKGEVTTDKAPTCTENGVQSIRCEVCDAQMESSVTELPALGHSYEENRVPATCTLAGSITRICTRCGDTTTELLPKTGHNLQLDPTASSMATCEEDGLMVYSCQNENCNKHEYKVQGALGHDWDTENLITLDPTETENGKTYQNCTRCSATKTVAILPSNNQAKKIEKVNNLSENPITADVTAAIKAIQNIDNEILDQQGYEELIGKVEKALKQTVVSNKRYEETTINGPKNISIIGATVAAAIEAEKKAAEPATLALDDPDYAFALAGEDGAAGQQIVIRSEIVAEKEKEQKPEDAKRYTDYKFYMNVYQKTSAEGTQMAYMLNTYAADNTNDELLAEKVTDLGAPVKMTLPVPKEYRGTNFKVMHIAADGTATEQAYALTADGTAASFTTKALGTYRVVQGSCTGAHVFVEGKGTVTKEATCTQAGALVRTCADCGDEVTTVIPQTEHVYSRLVEEKSKAATCAEEGTEVRKCENCDAEMTKTLAITKTHTYGEGIVDQEATCTQMGKKHKTCTICGMAPVEEGIPALGHNWASEYTTDVAPTCISQGNESQHCTRCEATRNSRLLAETAHTFADRDDPKLTWIYAENCSGQDTVEVTCLTEGCTATTTYRRQAEKASAHTWDDSKTIRKEATCTEDGSVTKTCASCGQEMVTEVLPKSGHSLAETPAQAPTCTTEGTKSYWTCGTCQKVFADAAGTVETTAANQKLAATGHSLAQTAAKAATCTAEGTKGYWTCSSCQKVFADAAGTVETTIENQKLAKSGHAFSGYVVTKQPTVLAEGTETRTCTRCGTTESRVIAKRNGTIRLTTKKLPLQVKKKVQLSRIVTDLAAGDSIASCVSSKPKVATVDNRGKVVGKSAGKAVVTVTLTSGVSAKVTIVVQKKRVAASSITNVAKSLKLKQGEKYTLAPVLHPITAADKVSYSSSNKKIVTVNKKGVITARKSGTAKITVRAGKKKVTVKVTVAKKAPTGMTKVPARKTLKKSKSFTIRPKLTPSGAEAKIIYRSSNKKVATVNAKGKVTAKKKAGTAIITVKAGGVTKTCVVTVK